MNVVAELIVLFIIVLVLGYIAFDDSREDDDHGTGMFI